MGTDIRRLGPLVLGIIALAATLSAASSAEAQYAENTAAACQDRVDNDGDGYADCADQDCGAFVFCAAGGAQAVVVAPGAVAPRRHWALAGSVIGFSAAGSVLALTTAAEITNGDGDAPKILGGIALVLALSLIPVSSAGATSARRAAGVRGCVGCRIAGWVLYGLACADGATILALALATDFTPPVMVISSLGILGATAAILMAADGLVARRAAFARPLAETTPARRWSLAPFVAPVGDETGLGGAVAGVSIVHM